MAEVKSAFAVGELVAGNYQVIGIAGSGGMGTVYRARDVKLERSVALKFLPAELNDSQRERDRFLREARTASALDHTNIGVIHGIGETEDSRAFIVMAYYEGSSLAQRLRAGPLPLAQALDIEIQVLRGLDHAHSHGIEHRDIKPSNIMLTQSGGVKIVDFGLAHFTQQTASVTRGISGTVAYMSPEQVLGKPSDPRSDLWAAGVVLVEMLTAVNPFNRETLPTTVFAIINEAPGALEGVPPEVQHIAYRALAKEPSARYQSAAEMLHELEAARGSLSLTDAAGVLPPPTRRFKEPASLRKTRELASVSVWQPAGARANSRRWIVGGAILGAIVVIALAVPASRNRIAAAFSAPAAAGGPHSVKPAAYEGYLTALGDLQRYDKPGNIDRAIVALQQSLRSDPLFALGYAELGEAYRLKYMVEHDARYLDLALENCQQAERLDDRIPAVYTTLAFIHDGQGKHDLAVQEFQQALDINPRDPEALRGMGSYYVTVGRLDDAETAYKKSAALRPDDWNGFMELGTFYKDRGKTQLAIDNYKQAVALAPDSAVALINLATAYLDAGDPASQAEAEKALLKSISIQPTYYGYANLGTLYQEQKRYRESAEALQKALRIDDKDYLVWDNLRSTYDWLHDKAQSNQAAHQELTRLEKRVRDQSQDSVAQGILATLYAKEGADQKALLRIQSALALAPNDPATLQAVADAYEAMGQTQQAMNYLREALKNGLSRGSLATDFDIQPLLGSDTLAADSARQPPSKASSK